MKKLLLIGLLSVAFSAMACETYSIFINGKIMLCTACGTAITCVEN